MSYFLPEQIKTIRQQWIPGMAQVVAAALSAFQLNALQPPYLQILFGLPFFLITAWIFLQAGDWKKIIRYGAIWLVAQTASIALSKLTLSTGGHFGWQILYNYCFILICLLGRQYVQGEKPYLLKGVLLWIIMSAGSSALLNIINFNTTLSQDSQIHPNFQFLQFAVVALTGYATPFIFHAFAFLTDNYFNIPGYKSILRSKVLVTGKKTYCFMYFVLLLTIIGCAIQLTGSIGFLYIANRSFPLFQSVSGVVVPVVLLAMSFVAFAAILASLYLIRNIITGRMATVKNANGLIYAFHFIPVVNLLTVFYLSEAIQEHHTRKENAVFYIQRETSLLAHWIVGLGIVVAVTNAIRTWMAYHEEFSQLFHSIHEGSMAAEYRMMRITLISVIVMYLIKVLGYILLYNHRKAVHLIVIMNIAIMMLSLFEVLPLALLFSVAALSSFYVMLEIFHPALHDDDALLITESQTE